MATNLPDEVESARTTAVPHQSPWSVQEDFLECYRAALNMAKGVVINREGSYDEIPIPDKFVFGDRSIYTLMWVKMMRIKSLLTPEQWWGAKEQAASVRELTRDRLRDNLIDLINYTAFLLAHEEMAEHARRKELGKR